MSLLDKALAAVMPLESEEKRAKARREAESLAKPDSWLAMVLDHHRQIERAFADALGANDGAARRVKARQLAVVLTGHSIAEEAVLYPAMADTGHKTHAGMGYDEQAMVKVEMALLEKLEPMSQDWTDKLTHIRDAVAHHVYQEESDWFPELLDETTDQAILTRRYTEEFERYVGSGKAGPAMFATQTALDTPA